MKKNIIITILSIVCICFTACGEDEPFYKDTDYWTVEDLTGVWVAEEDENNPNAAFIEFKDDFTYHSVDLVSYGAQRYDRGNYSTAGTNGRILYLKGYGNCCLYMEWMNKEHTKMRLCGTQYNSYEPDDSWSWTWIKINGLPAGYGTVEYGR